MSFAFQRSVRLADICCMKTIMYNGNRIDAPGSTLTGVEAIRYNGEIVSSRWSVLGAKHDFEVEEKGEAVRYEVRIGTRWTGFATCTVLRNGEMLYSDA
jgi:hypothetical protein